MFSRLRKYCKWHQKQVKIGGDWKYETRLVAWYGPCDYNYSGLQLDKNLNWAPELLDLLHRLIAMTRHEFNSCFCNLYRHGHDMCGWHADVHPQLGRNPPVASVSLGAVRVFEFRKKNGPPNFIRFPLFPGSLLVMEGATQEDWLHCLPRDTNCKEERVNLTFRTMYSLNNFIPVYQYLPHGNITMIYTKNRNKRGCFCCCFPRSCGSLVNSGFRLY